jgi:hypothetical protein
LHLCFIRYSFTASGFGSVVTGGLWVLVGEQFRCLSVEPEAAHHVGKGELQMARTGKGGGREREKQREREGGSDGREKRNTNSPLVAPRIIKTNRKLDSKQNKQSKCIYPDFIIRSQR